MAPPLLTAQNLHAVWDGAIVNSISESDRNLAASLNQKLASFSQNEQDTLAAGDEKDWTWESHETAIEIYKKLNIPVEPVLFPHNCQEAPAAVANLTLPLSQSYLDDNQALVREQLLKAGVRLPKMLNDEPASPGSDVRIPSK